MTRLRAWIASLPAGLVESAWLVLTMRLALSIFAVYVASERTIPQPCHFEEARNGWAAMPLQYKDGAAFKVFGVWERWDACWYANIATFGYRTDGGTSFFPLYPLLERVVAIGGPHVVVAGMLINVVATIAAAWGLYRLARRDHGDDVARRSILVLLVFPAAFFLLAPFSEAVFLALTVWSIGRGREGHWAQAAALALLAGFERPVGIFLALPLAWLAWPALRGASLGTRLWSVAAPAAAPLAGALFFLYTSRVVGRSVFDASAAWTGSAWHWPWDVLVASLGYIGRTGDPLQVLQLGLLILFTILLGVATRRIAPELMLFAAPQSALLWLRVLPIPLTSIDRYLVVVFPAFIVLALLLDDRRWRWSYVVVSLLLLGALANEFVVGNFVG